MVCVRIENGKYGTMKSNMQIFDAVEISYMHSKEGINHSLLEKYRYWIMQQFWDNNWKSRTGVIFVIIILHKTALIH